MMGAQQIGFAPMPAVALILSRFDRAQLGSFVEIAIDLMDVADGNPDVEVNGDELDGSSAEDDIWGHGGNGLAGPGCSLSDAGEDDDEDCGRDEGEPDYRKRRRYRRNGDGPGCKISDSDYGGEEPGEPDNAF